MFDVLCEDNFFLYAAKHYNNPHCVDEEFIEDLNRIKYIKKLLFRYKENGVLKERLVLNHIIIMNNMFGPKATVRILFFKLPEYHSCLKTFFEYLSIMPEKIDDIENKNIPIDSTIKQMLEKL